MTSKLFYNTVRSFEMVEINPEAVRVQLFKEAVDRLDDALAGTEDGVLVSRDEGLFPDTHFIYRKTGNAKEIGNWVCRELTVVTQPSFLRRPFTPSRRTQYALSATESHWPVKLKLSAEEVIKDGDANSVTLEYDPTTEEIYRVNSLIDRVQPIKPSWLSRLFAGMKQWVIS